MLLEDPASGRIADANRAAEAFYGYSHAQLRGMPVEAINTLPRDEIRRCQRMAMSGERDTFVFPHRLADGTPRTVEVHASPVAHEGTTLLCSIIHDVTARLSAEASMAASEARFRLLAENMLDLICLHDADGVYLYASPSSRDIMGIDPEEMVGMRPGRFILPEDMPRVAGAFARFAAEDAPSRDIIFRVHDASGRLRWLETRISPVRQADVPGAVPGARPALVTVTRDITHRKNIAAALLRESQITRAIARLSQAMLGTRGLADICRATREVAMLLTRSEQGLACPVDQDGPVHGLEEAAGRTGPPPRSPGGHPPGDTGLDPRLLRCLDEIVASAVARERGRDAGHPAPGGQVAAPPRGDAGRTAHLHCLAARAVAGDSTVGLLAVAGPGRPYTGKDRVIIDRLASIMALGIRRVQLEGQLVSAREDSETASRMKSEFLANMSHEIRTPLNGLLGMLQLLEGTSLDAEQLDYVDTALRSGHRLTDLLGDILDLARVEAGKLYLCQEPFELSDVFAAVADTFGPVCRERGLALSLYQDPSLPRLLLGDEVRVRQVVFNVVGNAVKFTDRGEIRVEAYPLPSPQPGVTRVFFTVADTGIGIPEEKLDTIFDSFTQADGAVTRKFEGAGLGLAIVKHLVELMDGHIVVETEPGEGATVSFCLRLGLAAETPPKAAGPMLEGEMAEGARLRVLIVEDERINRMTLRRMLEKMGHETAAAENGRAALEFLSREGCDCILMDIQMPELGGLETLSILRTDPAFAHRATIPVIALTAHAMSGDRERFLAAGMDGYLAKPVEISDLRRLLKSVRPACPPV
jgi:PAS domain S-box-containing protein